MVDEGMQGVEFYVANTDLQVLNGSLVNNKIVLGRETTKGLGAGANPEVGRQAALESEDEIREAVSDADMIFITAGLGGGTGTGAAPIFARLAQEAGALTVGIVTNPFSFEGTLRTRQAQEGLEEPSTIYRFTYYSQQQSFAGSHWTYSHSVMPSKKPTMFYAKAFKPSPT